MMDQIDKLFIFLFYAAAIGIPFCAVGMVCEYREKRTKK